MRITLILVMLLASCAFADSYDSKLESWVDHAPAELIKEWGEPTRAYKSVDGKDVYEYEVRVESFIDRGDATCRTTFEAENGKIVSWKWQGNSCH